jgi:hypothetical protein
MCVWSKMLFGSKSHNNNNNNKKEMATTYDFVRKEGAKKSNTSTREHKCLSRRFLLMIRFDSIRLLRGTLASRRPTTTTTATTT